MDSNASNPVTETSTSTQAPEVASSSTPTGTAANFNASTPVSNMEDLRTKAPTVYKAMMEGIATNIVNEMKDHQTRLKEMMREAQRNAEGK